MFDVYREGWRGSRAGAKIYPFVFHLSRRSISCARLTPPLPPRPPFTPASVSPVGTSLWAPSVTVVVHCMTKELRGQSARCAFSCLQLLNTARRLSATNVFTRARQAFLARTFSEVWGGVCFFPSCCPVFSNGYNVGSCTLGHLVRSN